MTGLVDLQFRTLGLSHGLATIQGRHKCFHHRKHRATRWFVAYEEYHQTARRAHDSLAGYFAALAHHKRIAGLPVAVTENDSLRMRFLAELSGVEEPVVVSGDFAIRHTEPLSPESPADTTRYLLRAHRASDHTVIW